MKNLNIGTQLRIGFSLILFLVFFLGLFSYIQNKKLSQQTDNLYNHPLAVRTSLGSLRSEILIIQMTMQNNFLTEGESKTDEYKSTFEYYKSEAYSQMDSLYKNYLGPKSDIDNLKLEFGKWNIMQDGIFNLIKENKIKDAIALTKDSGKSGLQAQNVFCALDKIDDFAKKKALSFHNENKDF